VTAASGSGQADRLLSFSGDLMKEIKDK
jgi:hypothetical protein